MPYVLESLVLQKDTRLVALVCPDFEAVDADKMTQEQLEVVMEENRKLVNADLAAYEQTRCESITMNLRRLLRRVLSASCMKRKRMAQKLRR